MRSSSRGWRVGALIGMVLVGLVCAAPALAQEEDATVGAEAATPPAWLTYTVHRTVDGGTGAYDGYTDSLRAAGRYDVRPDAGSLQIGARYTWVYRGERCEDGSEARDVVVTLPSRRYAGRTDLDDYDGREADDLATWVWVPPTLAVGDRVRILERDFVVIDRDPHMTEGGVVDAVHLRAEGTGTREDEYGSFVTRFVDEYWFDAATGYFLESIYDEHDTGSSEGISATFDWRETVRVTGASYLGGTAEQIPETHACRAPRRTASDGGGGRDRPRYSRADSTNYAAYVLLALVVAAPIGLFFLYRNLTRRRVLVGGLDAKVRDVAAVEQLPPLPPTLSPSFGAFLPHFVAHALGAGQKVAVLEVSDGRCVGLAIGDDESRVASMFAPDGDACELLRRHLGHTELFTEHRHETLPSVAAASQRAGVSAPRAYNVLETYEILELAIGEVAPYDPTVVSRMTESDLPAVAQLSREVYGVSGSRWAAAGLAAGDLGFVARVDGRVVGYAFATVVGERARLHGNTVAEAHRSKGLGRELVRARLASAAALGATRAVTEIATWNVGSLEAVRALGFASVGTMWVETSASLRVERKLVRR